MNINIERPPTVALANLSPKKFVDIGCRGSSLKLLSGSSLRFGSQVRYKGKLHHLHIYVCSHTGYFPSTELRTLGERESCLKDLGLKAYQVKKGPSARWPNEASP